MISVTIARPDGRSTIITNPESTIKGILTENNVNFQRATVMVDGVIMDVAGMNKSLAEHGVVDSCTIALSVKMDNA